MGLEKLRGRRALVTGASSGLGAEIARQLAAASCDLVLVARRRDRLEEIAGEIGRPGGPAVDVVAADLAGEEARLDIARRLEGEGKRVDVVVNNAGLGIFGELASTPWERTRSMIDLDVTALVHLTRLFLPGMLERGLGYILQVSSIGAFQPVPTYAVYSAAKSFVHMFGHAVNREIRGRGVSVTVLCPGNIATEFHEVAGQKLTAYQRLTMRPASRIARAGLQAMVRRRAHVVPGLLNWLLAWSNRFSPTWLAAELAGRLMR